jgi:hypothetical protein
MPDTFGYIQALVVSDTLLLLLLRLEVSNIIQKIQNHHRVQTSSKQEMIVSEEKGGRQVNLIY